MTKVELDKKISNVRTEINEEEARLAKLEEMLEVLLTFSSQCQKKSDSFFASVQKRKNKLFSISYMIDTVKAISSYSSCMSELLNGQSYNEAKKSIDAIMEKNEAKKKSLKNDIEDTEKIIKQLKAELNHLQNQDYDEVVGEGNG